MRQTLSISRHVCLITGDNWERGQMESLCIDYQMSSLHKSQVECAVYNLHNCIQLFQLLGCGSGVDITSIIQEKLKKLLLATNSKVKKKQHKILFSTNTAHLKASFGSWAINMWALTPERFSVAQGCVMCPLLVNMFINDLDQDLEIWGSNWLLIQSQGDSRMANPGVSVTSRDRDDGWIVQEELLGKQTLDHVLVQGVGG